MIGLAVLSYSMDEMMKITVGFFSIQIHWKVILLTILSFATC